MEGVQAGHGVSRVTNTSMHSRVFGRIAGENCNCCSPGSPVFDPAPTHTRAGLKQVPATYFWCTAARRCHTGVSVPSHAHFRLTRYGLKNAFDRVRGEGTGLGPVLGSRFGPDARVQVANKPHTHSLQLLQPWEPGV